MRPREESLRIRSSVDNELKERRKELQRQEKRHSQREESLERTAQSLERQEQTLGARGQELDKSKEELESLKGQQHKQLEETARLTMAEARELLLKKTEDESKHELARRYWELERQMKEEADQKARKVITSAIQRLGQ